jgi:hypothetical protein
MSQKSSEQIRDLLHVTTNHAYRFNAQIEHPGTDGERRAIAIWSPQTPLQAAAYRYDGFSPKYELTWPTELKKRRVLSTLRNHFMDPRNMNGYVVLDHQSNNPRYVDDISMSSVICPQLMRVMTKDYSLTWERPTKDDDARFTFFGALFMPTATQQLLEDTLPEANLGDGLEAGFELHRICGAIRHHKDRLFPLIGEDLISGDL